MKAINSSILTTLLYHLTNCSLMFASDVCYCGVHILMHANTLKTKPNCIIIYHTIQYQVKPLQMLVRKNIIKA